MQKQPKTQEPAQEPLARDLQYSQRLGRVLDSRSNLSDLVRSLKLVGAPPEPPKTENFAKRPRAPPRRVAEPPGASPSTRFARLLGGLPGELREGVRLAGAGSWCTGDDLGAAG